MIYQVTSGRNINIRTEGDQNNPVLLLLHGYMESSRVFDHLLGTLTQKYFVVLPDLPGHGESHVIKRHFTFEELAVDLYEVLQKLELKKLTFIGHSMGGYIGQAIAAIHPECFDHLYLLNSATWTARPEYVKLKERERKFIAMGKKMLLVRNSIPEGFAPQNREHVAEYIDLILDEAEKLSDRCIDYTCEAMQQRKSHAQQISENKIPVTILAGKHDTVAPLEKIQDDFQHWTTAKLVIFEHSGHHTFIEEADAFLDTIFANIPVFEDLVVNA